MQIFRNILDLMSWPIQTNIKHKTCDYTQCQAVKCTLILSAINRHKDMATRYPKFFRSLLKEYMCTFLFHYAAKISMFILNTN